MGYTAMEKVIKQFTDEQIEKFDRKLLLEKEKELRNITSKRIVHTPFPCRYRFACCISYNKAYHNALSAPRAPTTPVNKTFPTGSSVETTFREPYSFTHFHFPNYALLRDFILDSSNYSHLDYFSISAYLSQENSTLSMFRSLSPITEKYKTDGSSGSFYRLNETSPMSDTILRICTVSKKPGF